MDKLILIGYYCTRYLPTFSYKNHENQMKNVKGRSLRNQTAHIADILYFYKIKIRKITYNLMYQ